MYFRVLTADVLAVVTVVVVVLISWGACVGGLVVVVLRGTGRVVVVLGRACVVPGLGRARVVLVVLALLERLLGWVSSLGVLALKAKRGSVTTLEAEGSRIASLITSLEAKRGRCARVELHFTLVAGREDGNEIGRLGEVDLATAVVELRRSGRVVVVLGRAEVLLGGGRVPLVKRDCGKKVDACVCKVSVLALAVLGALCLRLFYDSHASEVVDALLTGLDVGQVDLGAEDAKVGVGRGKGSAGSQEQESFGDHGEVVDCLLLLLRGDELVCRELGYVGLKGAWRQRVDE